MTQTAGPSEPAEATAPSEEAQTPSGGGIVRAFSSLRYHDFRLLWTGGVISNVGSMMQTYSVQHLVFALTGSAVWLGFDAFAMWVSMNLLLPFGGVLADRLDRRRVVIVGNLLLGLIAAVLAVLRWQGHLQKKEHVIYLIIASAISGAISGLVFPAIMSMMPQLVPRRDLPNAVALNSMQFNISRVLGPVAGGLAMALGATWCFGLNAVSFVAVIIAAWFIHWRPSHTHNAKDGILVGMLDGLAYFRSRPDLIFIETAVILMSFAASTMISMLPAFVDIYGLGFQPTASALAKLMSFFGVGALGGAMFNAWHSHRSRSPWLAFPLLALLGVTLVLQGLQPPFPMAMALAVASGVFFMISGNRLFASVLASTPEKLRGRISSIHFIAFGIGLPVGSMVAGLVARSAGIRVVFTIYGGGLLVAVVLMFFFLRSCKVHFQADGHLEPQEVAQASQEGAA